MEAVSISSLVPTLKEFDPYKVPYQVDVISLVRQEYNYNLGPLEILLSGSVGSSKSLLMAHIAVTHMLMHSGSGVLIGRRVHKDMKNTIWAMIIKHYPELRRYWNKSDTTLRLPNGSIAYGVSWDKGDYEKFRSYELSLAVIEELTENETIEMIPEIKMRLGRAQGVRENLLICATNPSSPSHPAYTYFMENQSESRKVFYSKTEDNPFVPKWYIESLRKTLDPKMALRMLKGQWIEIAKENVYYNYDDTYCYRDEEYKWDTTKPLDLFLDFNNDKAGTKPMSVGAGQYIKGSYHAGKTWLIAGMRTLDMMDEVADSGLLDGEFPMIRVYGDASGRASDTRSNRSDWDLIENFLSNFRPKKRVRLDYEIEVPLANPPIKERHNLMNAMFKNDLGLTRFYIYKDAKDLGKGFRLTQLKKNARLIEDDTLREQHITTAAGYWVHRNELLSRDIAPLVIS